MYKVVKKLEISGAHQLSLNYDSKCKNLHGHNWIVYIYAKSEGLDQNGMVIDFTEIKRKICDRFDHKYLNDIVPFNPTAEHMARHIASIVGEKCYKVVVQESEGNTAIYEI